jgi:hypothetical protein
MIGARALGQTGVTRTCPHCRATILDSAAICPGCKHHLRFDKDAKPGGAAAPRSAWKIEGTLEAVRADSPTEYTILVIVRDERNQEVARHVVNVGSLQGKERRVFELSVETAEPRAGNIPRR